MLLKKLDHSSIHFLPLIRFKVTVGQEFIPAVRARGIWQLGKRDRQSLTLTFTPMANLESPVILALCMSFECVGTSNSWRGTIQTWGKHANPIQKGPSQAMDSHPEPSCCDVTVITTHHNAIHPLDWTTGLHQPFYILYSIHHSPFCIPTFVNGTL